MKYVTTKNPLGGGGVRKHGGGAANNLEKKKSKEWGVSTTCMLIFHYFSLYLIV